MLFDDEDYLDNIDEDIEWWLEEGNDDYDYDDYDYDYDDVA